MYDIIIIGAGPAGLSAAIYGTRAMKKVLVLDGNGYGGQIINSSVVENYPGVYKTTGYEFATILYNQAVSLGAEIKGEEVIELLDKNTLKTKENVYRFKTLIIATGLKKRTLGLYGEKELIGRGISYCAVCDGNFFKDQVVAVIGSGATAVEDAIYLSNIASKVYVINRKDVFKCDKMMLNKLIEKENIDIIKNANVTELIGEEKLTSIKLSTEEILNMSGLFIAIGYKTDNEIFKNFISLDDQGYIISEDTKTTVDNIFVAGDTRTKSLRQLITATSDGAVSASEAILYLNKHN